MVIIAPKDSTIQNQLLWLFGLDAPNADFQMKQIEAGENARLDFATRFILDKIGIDAEEPEADKLDSLIEKFGTTFPSTKDFSQLARDSLKDVSPLDGPDETILAWIEREDLLFRRLERLVVAERLESGFVADGNADVDGFIAFSLRGRFETLKRPVCSVLKERPNPRKSVPCQRGEPV